MAFITPVTQFTPKHQGETWFPKIFSASLLPRHTQFVLKQRLSNLQSTSGQSSANTAFSPGDKQVKTLELQLQKRKT